MFQFEPIIYKTSKLKRINVFPFSKNKLPEGKPGWSGDLVDKIIKEANEIGFLQLSLQDIYGYNTLWMRYTYMHQCREIGKNISVSVFIDNEKKRWFVFN